MKKLNILFVNVPVMPYDSIIQYMANDSTIAHRLEMPLGILYLSAYLKKEQPDHKVHLLDYSLHLESASSYENISQYIESIAENYVDFQPDIVAFSVSFSTSHRFFVESLELLKNRWSESLFIAGGNHLSNIYSTILNDDNLDYVARGEGEISFSKFVKQIACGDAVNVRGIYNKYDISYGDDSSQLGDFVEHLDNIPYPDWELLDVKSYLGSSGRKRSIGESEYKKTATIMTSRGCVYKCTFCSSHSVFGRNMRYRSDINVVGEVKYLYEKYGVTLFVPEDDLFTINAPRIIKLLDSLSSIKIPNFELQFPNALSVNTLSEDVIDALIRSGMSIASLAIESGSDYVQKNIIKKRCKLENAKKVISYLKTKDVVIRCYYVLGFPRETKEQLQMTVDYAKALNVDWSAFSIATPLVGSEMYDEFVKMGCIEDNPEMWSKSSYSERFFDTPNISYEYLNDFAYRANLEVNFIDNYNLASGNYDKAASVFKDIVGMHPFHIFGWKCLAIAEKGRNNYEKADDIMNHIEHLVKTDKRSAKMLSKYGELLEKFNTRYE